MEHDKADALTERLKGRGDRWLCAYYYGFDPTGVEAVDLVLAAVALAGKGAHNTADWLDPSEYYAGEAEPPRTAADLIQEMAERCAAQVRELRETLEHAVAELNFYGHLNNSQTGEPTPASHMYAEALAKGAEDKS